MGFELPKFLVVLTDDAHILQKRHRRDTVRLTQGACTVDATQLPLNQSVFLSHLPDFGQHHQ